MGSKVDEFFIEVLEVDKSYGGYRIRNRDNFLFLQEKIDWQDLDAIKWLHVISSSMNGKNRNWLEDKSPGEKRAYKKLQKIAKNVRVEKGYFLASLFINVDVVRNRFVTEVMDGKELDEFTCNPYDMDYGISPDKIGKTLGEAEDIEYPDASKKPNRIIFSVTTHDAIQPPACMKCVGKGFFRCEKCEGSGREQYVDGNFAGSEERIKTGQCSNCFGTGKVQCNECMGTGKTQLVSKQYQMIKSFEDIKKISGYANIECSCSFGGDKVLSHWIPSIPSLEEWNDYDWQTQNDIKHERGRWSSFFNEKEIKDGIVKLYKNQKEILVDSSQSFPKEIPEECKNLYEKNQQRVLEYFQTQKASEKDIDQGKLACSIEKHLVIPMFRIFCSFDGDENFMKRSIDVYELSGETRCFMNHMNPPELGFFKSLFV